MAAFRVFATLFVSLLVSHATSHAQGSRANGYSYSPWQLTQWSAIEIRTLCEGPPVSGVAGGPIKWRVEFRNRTKEPINFDYQILPPATGKPAASSGRLSMKKGSVEAKIAVVDASSCADGVLTQLGKVRVGADADSVPYVQPDRRG